MEVKLNKIYRHFKGNYYYVKDIAYDSETKELVVVYQALYDDNKVWVRKMSSFQEKVDINNEENIYKQEYRFELINLKEKLK